MRQIGAWSQQAQAKGKGKDKGKDKGQSPTLAAKSWRLTVLELAAGVGGLLALADRCTWLAVLVLGAWMCSPSRFQIFTHCYSRVHGLNASVILHMFL